MSEDTIYFNLCPNCRSFIEILNIDGNFIVYKCLNCDENKENKLTIKEYIESIKNLNKCSFCQTNKNSENWKFCVKCRSIICNDCISNHSNCDGNLINFNEIGTKCLEHPKAKNNENTSFCKTCKRHICKECKKSRIHASHQKVDFDEILLEDEKSNFNKINDSLKQLQKDSEKEDEKQKKKLTNSYEKQKTKLNDELEDKINRNEEDYQNEIKEAERKCKEEIENFTKLQNEKLKQYTQERKEKKNNQKVEIENSNKIELQKLEKDYKKEIQNLENNIRSKKKNINNLIKINDIVNSNYEKNENNYYACKNINNLLTDFNKNKNIIIENLKNYNGDNNDSDDDNDDNNSHDFNYDDVNISTSILKRAPKNESGKKVLGISETLIDKECTAAFSLDNSIEVYESFNKDQEGINIIYPNKNIIKCFNLKKKEVIKELDSHTDNISGFRHFYDQIENKNLILSISCNDNNLKVWDTDDWSCLLDLQKVNEKGHLYSACFLNVNNLLYIVTSNAYNDGPNEPIKIFDLKGNEIKQIQTIKYIYSIDTYYDEEKSQYYIIAGCRGCIESYSFDEGTKYKTYESVNPDEIYHNSGYDVNTKDLEGNNFKIYSFKIFKQDEIVKLILCKNNKVKIWDFHSGNCLNEIQMTNIGFVNSLCEWDKNEILVGGYINLKLINIEEKKEVESIANNYIIAMKKISNKDLGNCLIALENNINGFKIKLYK